MLENSIVAISFLKIIIIIMNDRLTLDKTFILSVIGRDLIIKTIMIGHFKVIQDPRIYTLHIKTIYYRYKYIKLLI